MKKKASILFVNLNSYPCDVGGLEVFNYNLIENLKHLLNIKVLTFCNQLEIDGVEMNLIKRFKGARLTKPASVLYFLLKNRKNYNLTHLSFSRSHWLFWLVFVFMKKFFRKEYIITIHGGGLTKWKPNFAYQWLFKNAKAITGVSDRIIDEYSRRSKRHIIYTPPLVRFDVIDGTLDLRKKWGLDEKDTMLLYVGSLKKLKSVDTLIDGIGHLEKSTLDKLKLKVLIAGNGVEKQKLISRSKELKVDKYVHFLGNVSQKSLPELYAIANYYTICSEYEGLPISMLQAFANGLACISSDAPGLSGLSQKNKNSMLFEVKNSKDFALKVLKLMENDKVRTNLEINAKEFYKINFSYDLLIDQFLTIVNDADEK